MAAKPFVLSLGFSVAVGTLSPPKGLLEGVVAGLEENRFEAPDEPPKRFF